MREHERRKDSRDGPVEAFIPKSSTLCAGFCGAHQTAKSLKTSVPGVRLNMLEGSLNLALSSGAHLNSW